MNPHTTLPEPPPERFNFAAHLLALNTGRAEKAAFIDDASTLNYGRLDQRVRCFAAGLIASGLRREERVLLLMHDQAEWPVAFLGALYAGVVLVAVNTLLTLKDYAYMLAHSRSQAAIVSAALLPDAEGLTKTKAYVVLKAGAVTDEAELKAFVKDRLAPFKYPRSIVFVAELPKTATGKIQRFKLRELEPAAG